MGKFDERIEEFGLLVGDHDRARRVEDIALDRIIPDPGNPRRHFDEAELADLAASIAARGVLQPITVTPPDADGVHRIRLGERRFRASQRAGLAVIPAIVAAPGDAVHLLADQIVENDQRANLSSVEIAQAIARMLKGGMNQAQIAAALGRSKQFVSLYAAYGDMADYLKAALPRAPMRLLYDLHRAARDFPDEVEAYVAGWDEEGATLAAGSHFIAGLKASGAQEQAPRSEGGAETVAGEPRSAPAPRRGLSAGERVSVDARTLPVLVDGRAGLMLLPLKVRVVFDDGQTAEVASSSVMTDQAGSTV